MKNLSLITVLALLLFSFSLVSAQQETIRFYHPQSTNLTIFEKCRVDGAVCDSSYTCSLSVISNDNFIVVDTVTMLGTSTYRNFTLNTTQTSVNGIYEATVDCVNSTLAGSNTFFYQITPNGSVPVETGQGLVLIASITFLLMIILILCWLSFKSANVSISLAFISFAVLLMFFGIGFSLNVLQLSFGTFGDIINNFSTVYVLFTILLSVGAVGLIVYLIYVALRFYWNLRGMGDNFSITP